MVLNENKILIYGSCTCIVEIKGSLIISKEILLQNLIQSWARGGVHIGPLPKKASLLPEPLVLGVGTFAQYNYLTRSEKGFPCL